MCEDKVAKSKESKQEKWVRECFAQGFKFIGKSLEKPGYSIAECMVCGYVDNYEQKSMRKVNVRCESCKIAQWSEECLAQGFKYLGKSSEKPGCSIAECMTCSHVDSYDSGAIRKGNVRCESCKITQYSNECFANGFKFLGKSSENTNYAITECMTCGHVDSYDSGAMRKGDVRCTNCKIAQWSSECLTNGFKFIGQSSEKPGCSIAECMMCGHVDSYQRSHIRIGKVRCEQCLIQKYKSLVKPGWQYVDKFAIKRQTYNILNHSCSDNLVTVHCSDFLKGSYDCPHCSQTHFDEPSYFYIIKVAHEDTQIIKIGVANDTDRRFRQYGLPDDAKVEIIRVEPFETKRLAMKFESTMKQALKEYKVDNEIAKAIFTIQGHTEVFTEDSLNLIKRLLGESSTA